MGSTPDTTAALYQQLQASGLLTEARLRELSTWIAKHRPDVAALAKEIARRGWLTPFQIKEIARGRAAGLRLANRYVLIDVVGEGGMGRVYRAHDTRMGRDVAFKVIRKEKLSHPSAAGRFIQEIQALGKLAPHPNIVAVYDAAQVGDNHYCVMEFIDGTDLTKRVRDRGPLSIPEACEAIRQTALGLQHAFETGLVHRDIKPSNIIVPRNNGPVKLVDLGLARVIDTPPGGEDAHRVTQEGFVIGTPDFLAPEQARNPMSVDIRADIYALGCTLYYILTGRVPYEGANATEKLIKHCTDPPPLLLPYRPDSPPQLEQIIHWCMAKEAEGRPQAPLQLAMALQPFCPAPYAGAGSGGHAALGARGAAAAGYPQPHYAAPHHPQPLSDPNPSSQIFKLPPPDSAIDPIRRRASGGFPTSLFMIAIGAIFVIGVLGYATYRLFLQSDEPPPVPFTNSCGMKMVKLEDGTFRMGSPDTELGRRPDEGPMRDVTIRGPIFMSATEVTGGQFTMVMGSNPSRAVGMANRAEHLPVENVSWEQAVEFCKKLTEKEKGQPWMRKGWEYRLPTEAEWEYACRAGTSTPTAFGDRLVFGTQALFRPSGDDPYELGGPEQPPRFAQSAGSGEANKFGFFDMHGNVAEWCRDWYRSEAYRETAGTNPTGPADGDRRVIRGGSFRDPATNLRSATRYSGRPIERFDHVGFRVVYAPVLK